MTRLFFSFPSMLLRATAPAPSHKKVLVLTGPTAVGKSSTALNVARRLNAEIISADSVQLYRHLDIASNKPTIQEQAQIPHHLLDIVSPTVHNFTAGDFFRKARAAIDDVHSRGRLPIVVGGTMMYVRWLIRGPPATPPAPEEAKERVKQKLQAVDGDWENALQLLGKSDPKRAQELTKNDWYRLARAMEVVETTGVPMTDIPLQGGAPKAQVHALDYDFRCVFLYADRVMLNRRIDERCEQMIVGDPEADSDQTNSVLEEVARLLCSKELRVAPGSPALAIGYRQTIAYLVRRALRLRAGSGDGIDEEDGRDSAAQAFREYVDAFQSATRGYAKQQMAWFRKEKDFRWVHAESGAVDSLAALVDLSEDEYRVFCDVGTERQTEIREDMVRQGKLMKTYIPERKLLIHGSELERRAVATAEKCVGEIAGALETLELNRMLSVVTR